MNNTAVMSENINEIMSALSKAQGKIQPASKDKANPFFKSKYADLASIWEACRDALSENGLAVVQTIQKNAEGMTLITTLGHSSGQWIKSEMPIIVAKSDPQTLGSAITYYRRYSLSAMVGVAPNDDDDGEKAQINYRNQPNKSEPAKKISDVETEHLRNILKDCEKSYQEAFMKNIKKEFNANLLSEIPVLEYPRVKSAAFKNMQETQAKLKEQKETELSAQEN